MLIFFWQYGQADDGAAPAPSATGRYQLHASKGVSIGRGLSIRKSVAPVVSTAWPEVNDD